MKQFKIPKSFTNRDSEVIRDYFRDISKIPMIDAEEEIRLANLISKGLIENASEEDKRIGKEASDKLVTANLRFVISVAKQYQGNGIPLIDLINEGNIGLIRASKTFDPTKGFKFISYAVWWIRQSITQALFQDSRLIRIPISQTSALTKINKTIESFEKENERIPSTKELSKILGYSENRINDILLGNISYNSVDTPLSDDKEAGTLIDVIPNTGIKDSDYIVSDEDSNINLKELLNKFPPREQDILRMYFGLEGVYSMTYPEIGKRFGLTGERIRQICLKTLEIIKRDYLDLAKELL